MSKQKKISGFTRARMMCEIGINAILKTDLGKYDFILPLFRAIDEIAGELEKQREG